MDSSYTISGTYTDFYELTMGEVYFLQKKNHIPVCFDYLFRKTPNGGGYVLFAGLEEVLNLLENLRFTDEDIAYLRNRKLNNSYLDFLKKFKFNGGVYAVAEGELVFPNCPILRVEANLFEAQLVETLVLNFLNFQSLIATKASRMRQVAGNRELSEFGMRRAQGLGAMSATRAAIIGGFQTTSNVYAGQLYGIPTVGTMAHSFIETYDTELDAFRAFASSRPANCIFLVDTYDTLRSGIPNAITVAKEMEKRGERAVGIRLDSGDLAWLSKAARKMLDEAGLSYMKIVVSNQLDEFVIKSLLEQGASIDIFGVGTKLVTGYPDGVLDGVYKLSEAGGKPRLKLSENLQKTTLPGKKQVYRAMDDNGSFFGADAILLTDEQRPTIIYHPLEPAKSLDISKYNTQPLLKKVMSGGKRLVQPASLTEIAAYAQSRLQLLPLEYKRFENPHVYKTGVSKKLLELRNKLVQEYKSVKDESSYADFSDSRIYEKQTW